MWILVVIVNVILAFTLPERTAGVYCSEEGLRDCEVKVLKFLNSEEESKYDEFCENLKSDIECPIVLPENCKTQFPAASYSYTLFMEFVQDWCSKSSSDRKIWFKIGFCATRNAKYFSHCFKMHKLKNESVDNNTAAIDCEYYDFLYCMSNQVSISCGEEREYLSKFIIKDGIHKSYEEYCRSCSFIIGNRCVLDFFSFLVLILNYKFLHQI